MTAPAQVLTDLTLSEVARAIASREVAALEVVDATLARIEATDGELNAYLDVWADQARAVAVAADAALAAGAPLGPLHGVPLGIKDIVAVRGHRAGAASKILQKVEHDRDATVVARLRSAGAVLVGSLNMHEFAYGVTSDNPHHGAVRNPWDTDRFPAGSSGGSGAAVAARSCFGALGTDTGASVRLPAAINGIVGLRPTIGRVSNDGIVTLAWTLDTCGPMARTAEDCARILEVIAGHDRRDPNTALHEVPQFSAQLAEELDGVGIGVLDNYAPTLNQDDVQGAVAAACDELRSLGADVRPVSIPDLEYAMSALLTIDACEPAAYHADWIRSRADEYGPDLRMLLDAAETYSAVTYLQAQRYRSLLAGHFASALQRFDAILTPTVSFTALPVGETTVTLSGGRREEMLSAAMRYTALASLTGLPGLSVPCGFDANNLPIGFQLIGRAFSEGELLSIGHAYQGVTAWHSQAPTL